MASKLDYEGIKLPVSKKDYRLRLMCFDKE